MSVIQNFLTKILEARYGEEVRGSIHDAIDQCYKDATGNPESVAAVVEQNDQMAELLENTPYTVAVEESEYVLPVHTINDGKTAEYSTWSSTKIQEKLDELQDNLNNNIGDAEVKLQDRFLIIEGSHNGIKFDNTVQKTVTLGTSAALGGASNLQVIFAGQDQCSHYESATGSIEENYKNVYQPMVSAFLSGYDNDQVYGELTPVIDSITESNGSISLKFTLKPVYIIYDLDMYYDIKYRIILMKKQV